MSALALVTLTNEKISYPSLSEAIAVNSPIGGRSRELRKLIVP